MKFLFFTKGDRTVASSRYRAYYLAEELDRRGFEVSVVPVKQEGNPFVLFSYLKLLFGLGPEHILYLQRTIYNKYFLLAVMIARSLGRTYVFDIDDAVYEHSPLKVRWLVRNASVVTCGSKTVLEWVKNHNKNTILLLNGLPLHLYSADRHTEAGVVGWIGDGPAHIHNLSMLPEVFNKLRKLNTHFHFRLIGALGNRDIYDLFKNVPGVEIIDSLDWDNTQRVAQEISKFEVGIMPLENTTWNQSKNFKALEYLACAVPAVVSPRKALTTMLGEHDCLMFAETVDEWVNALAKLLEDVELNRAFGENGRRLVEQQYSTQSMTEVFVKALTGGK